MNCMVCGKEGNYTFCENHAPLFGQVIRLKGLSIYHGRFKVLSAISDKYLFKLRIVNWWLGTDAVTLNTFPPGSFTWHVRIVLRRIKFRLFRFVIDEHWYGEHDVFENLARFFPARHLEKTMIKHVVYPPLIQHKCKRKPLVVLIYDPTNFAPKRQRKYKGWIYGHDVILELKRSVDFCHWFVVGRNADMRDVFPLIDCAVLTSRQKGVSRLERELIVNEIPYYRDFDNEAKVKDIIQFLRRRLGG